MVRFRNGKPAGIYYSQHRDGAAYDWDDKELTIMDERVCEYYPSMDHISDIVLARCIQRLRLSCQLSIRRVCSTQAVLHS